MKVSIYIPKAKEALYRRAKQRLRGKMSALFVRHLERELAARGEK